MTRDRERDVSRAFVALSSSLVDGGDIVDLLTELTSDCARLLDIASAGLLLADRRGVLHVVAASSERTRNLELFQLQRNEGPCRDCFHAGAAVSAADLSKETARWPQFAAAAEAAGFASVHALPMRLHDTVLGALGLFGTSVGAPTDDDLDLAQALAHVASVALVADRIASDRSVVNEQLQSALSSRVRIEQAKGLLAQLGQIEMHEAFAVLRRYARDNNQRLSDVAGQLVGRELDGRALLDHAIAAGELVRTAP
jgi:transcriptional regulator with GAF, ATPase, and Fis domain